MAYKQPVSVLVVVFTVTLDVLLLERARHPGYWQSVTGSREGNEAMIDTACRELGEETGLMASGEDIDDWNVSNEYEIFHEWRDRYAPGVTRNVEHVFGICLSGQRDITLSPGEHRASRWLPWQAAAEACFSWSNRDAILRLPKISGHRVARI